MKKLLFFLAVVFMACSQWAYCQPLFENMTPSCTVTIQEVCYDPTCCALSTVCGVVAVLPNTSVSLSSLSCACSVGSHPKAYLVCWPNSQCNYCVVMRQNSGTGGCYPVVSQFACAMCDTTVFYLSWDISGNLELKP